MKKVLLILSSLLFSATISKSQNLLAIPDTMSGATFNLNILDTSNVFYPGYTTNTFGINAKYLGPTLFLNKGDSVSMNVSNQLMDTTTIHWHGLHVSPMNDGGPHSIILPGTSWNPKFKIRDHSAMYWYHPHLHMMTNMHASMGAAGLIIVRDSIERTLNLPRTYGKDDFPLVIQSKCFDNNKQIVIGNSSDSVMLINGTRNAYLPTPAQVVRFRLLNASPERVYNVGLQGNLTFYQIGTDGGLLDNPVPMIRLRLAPGERADVLVDFSGKNGQSIKLMSFASELPNAIYGALQPGMGAGQTIPGYTANVLNGADFKLMTLNIVAPTTSPITTIPTTLTTNTPWSIGSVNATRTLTFMPVNMGPTAIQGPFMINNSHFNMDVINYSIPFDNIEVWTLINQTPIAHPFHIHDVQFYITEINGVAPPANMVGRKDVVLVPGGGQFIKFITKFETFCDSMATYMYHCHMLPHEDDGMMGQFNVICSTSVGVKEVESDLNNLIVYPNPASDKVTLKFNSKRKIVAVTLYDYSGEIIFCKNKLNDTEVSLNTDNQSSGIYFIEVKTSQGILYKKVNLIK